MEQNQATNKEIDGYETQDKKQYLVNLMEKGYYLYPCYIDKHGVKKPRYIKGSMEHGYKDATNDPSRIDELFKPSEDGTKLTYLVGINLSDSGLICLDFDNNHNGNNSNGSRALQDLLAVAPDFIHTVKERSKNGGFHFYFDAKKLQDNELRMLNRVKNKIKGLEVLKDSAMIFPSENYSQLGSNNLASQNVNELPEDLKDYLTKIGTGSIKPLYNSVADDIDKKTQTYQDLYNGVLNKAKDALDKDYTEGSRNNALFHYACTLRYLDMDKGDALDNVIEAIEARDFSDNPIDHREASNIVNSAYKYQNEGDQKTINDAYQERRFYDEKVNEIRNNIDKDTKSNSINKARRLIFTWKENHPEQADKAQPVYPNVVADIMVDCFNFVRLGEDAGSQVAIYVDDPDHTKYGLYTQDYDYLEEIIYRSYAIIDLKHLKEAIRKIELTPNIRRVEDEELEENGLKYIPVGNGLFNQKTKQLEPWTPEKVFLSKVATNYNPNATSPVIKGWDFDKWLNDLARDKQDKEDPQIVKMLWQVIADSLNGSSSREKAIFLYSAHGSSGKGTFQALIQNLVGASNIATLKLVDFSKRFALARALGKSVIIGDDNSSTYVQDVSDYNSILTGEHVTIEAKNQNAFSAVIKATIIQSFNEIPKTDNPAGFGRRMLPIPFRQHFTDEGNGSEKINNRAIKKDYLKRPEVLEYVMYKALNEYADFEAFYISDASRNILNEYLSLSDPIQDFIEEEFIPLHVSVIPTQTLYSMYKSYCFNTGIKAVSKNKLIVKVKELLEDREDGNNYTNGRKRITQAILDEVRSINIGDASKEESTAGKLSLTYYGNPGDSPKRCFYKK